MKFIVCNILQNLNHSNGIKGMAHLCRCLTDLGHESYIFPLLDWNTPLSLEALERRATTNTQLKRLLNTIMYVASVHHLKVLKKITPQFIEDAIVVYSETTTNNILAARQIVRFLGSKDGLFTNGAVLDASCFKPTPFILAHSKVLVDNPHHVLFYADVDSAFLAETPGFFYGRKLDLAYVGKGQIFNTEITLPANTVEITRQWPAKKMDLALLLRNTRFLYTFDHFSNLNFEAVLCGAIPVFCGAEPWNNFSRDLDRSELGPLPYVTASDVKRVDRKTISDFHKKRSHLISLQKQLTQNYVDGVKQFVEKVIRHFS